MAGGIEAGQGDVLREAHERGARRQSDQLGAARRRRERARASTTSASGSLEGALDVHRDLRDAHRRAELRSRAARPAPRRRPHGSGRRSGAHRRQSRAGRAEVERDEWRARAQPASRPHSDAGAAGRSRAAARPSRCAARALRSRRSAAARGCDPPASSPYRNTGTASSCADPVGDDERLAQKPRRVSARPDRRRARRRARRRRDARPVAHRSPIRRPRRSALPTSPAPASNASDSAEEDPRACRQSDGDRRRSGRPGA